MLILHKHQLRLLEILKSNQDEPLTIRELMDRLGVTSPSVVQHHLLQLENKGYLRKNPANPKDYQILADSPDKDITYLNQYGLAQCGPSGSILDGNPIDRIPISSKILGFPSSEAFMVKAKGDSMEPKINAGDLVIAKKTSEFKSGGIYVCINNEQALIKQVNNDGKNLILASLNPDYQPFVAAIDFRIEGEVRGILSYQTN